jgi:hypothetical protein
VTKNGKKKFRRPIGAPWARTDGKGFNQKLDRLPINGAEIVVREIGADGHNEGNGRGSAPYLYLEAAPAGGDRQGHFVEKRSEATHRLDEMARYGAKSPRISAEYIS